MEPQTIQDTSFPLLDGSSTDITGTNTNPVLTDSGASVPTKNLDTVFPPAIIAQETIAQSLNTETKAIKGTFIFESLGAIKIGDFSQGVSGEVDISPNGITGKNVNGDITFAIDGTTGDATFLGTLSAGTLIGGDGTVIIGIGGSGGGRIVLYNSGVPQILIGDSS